MITAHAFILPFKREQTLWERNSWVFPGFTRKSDVSTVPSKSWRKDNSALLELCYWKSRVWIVQVPCQRNGTFSATTISSLVRFFPRSCRFHVQTELQIAFFSRHKSKNRAWRFGKAAFFRQRKKNCKQTDWADFSVLYGDLKHTLFVILDQSERTFYLAHLIILLHSEQREHNSSLSLSQRKILIH